SQFSRSLGHVQPHFFERAFSILVPLDDVRQAFRGSTIYWLCNGSEITYQRSFDRATPREPELTTQSGPYRQNCRLIAFLRSRWRQTVPDPPIGLDRVCSRFKLQEFKIHFPHPARFGRCTDFVW